jgi:hypothetical protein
MRTKYINLEKLKEYQQNHLERILREPTNGTSQKLFDCCLAGGGETSTTKEMGITIRVTERS